METHPLRLDRVESDIDLRLGSLWADLMEKELTQAELDVAAVFVRAAYSLGYHDGQQEPEGQLDLDVGPSGPERLKRANTEVDLRVASLWPYLLLKGLADRVLPVVAAFIRAAYSAGHYDGQEEPHGKLQADNDYSVPPGAPGR